MKEVFGVMLSLVRNRVFGDEIDTSEVRKYFESEEISKLYALSKFHDLSHLIGACIEPFSLSGDADILAKLRKKYFAAIYRYRGIEHELHNIKALFTEEKLAHMPLKGSVIRGLYPEPWMRTSCDIDILVREDEFDRFADLLVKKLGYKEYTRSFHDVSFLSPGGVHVELHFTLIEDFTYPKINELLSDVWSDAIRDGESYTYFMSNEKLYFYHIAHMMKHFMVSGCGIRFFIDLFLLDTKLEFDRERVNSMLEYAGLLSYAERSSKMARIWFLGEQGSEFYDSYEKHIIRGGIYGTTESRVIMQRERKGGKIGYAMRRIFLPYMTLKEIFPILKKHKWLTPVFEVVRWFKLLFGGKLKSSVNELKNNASVSDGDAKEAAKMLVDLGLCDEKIIKSKKNKSKKNNKSRHPCHVK